MKQPEKQKASQAHQFASYPPHPNPANTTSPRNGAQTRAHGTTQRTSSYTLTHAGTERSINHATPPTGNQANPPKARPRDSVGASNRAPDREDAEVGKSVGGDWGRGNHLRCSRAIEARRRWSSGWGLHSRGLRSRRLRRPWMPRRWPKPWLGTWGFREGGGATGVWAEEEKPKRRKK